MPHAHLTGGRPPRDRYIGHIDFKRLVDRIGVKQKVLAAWLGVSGRTLRYWLSGAINAPKSVVVILQVLDVRMGNACEPTQSTFLSSATRRQGNGVRNLSLASTEK